jgi:hypothetical protein
VVPHPAGSVVLVRFPFSDLSKTKLRPAVVLADVGRGDRILRAKAGIVTTALGPPKRGIGFVSPANEASSNRPIAPAQAAS